jgi:hypothetical protein
LDERDTLIERLLGSCTVVDAGMVKVLELWRTMLVDNFLEAHKTLKVEGILVFEIDGL